MKDYRVEWVRGYIGSCDGKTRTIYLNEFLLKDHAALDAVLSHERKHLDYKGFYNKEDFVHDLTDGFDLRFQAKTFFLMARYPEMYLPFQWNKDRVVLVLWPALVYLAAIVVLAVGSWA